MQEVTPKNIHKTNPFGKKQLVTSFATDVVIKEIEEAYEKEVEKAQKEAEEEAYKKAYDDLFGEPPPSRQSVVTIPKVSRRDKYIASIRKQISEVENLTGWTKSFSDEDKIKNINIEGFFNLLFHLISRK